MNNSVKISIFKEDKNMVLVNAYNSILYSNKKIVMHE